MSNLRGSHKSLPLTFFPLFQSICFAFDLPFGWIDFRRTLRERYLKIDPPYAPYTTLWFLDDHKVFSFTFFSVVGSKHLNETFFFCHAIVLLRTLCVQETALTQFGFHSWNLSLHRTDSVDHGLGWIYKCHSIHHCHMGRTRFLTLNKSC
jgi:hypothetical protein